MPSKLTKAKLRKLSLDELKNYRDDVQKEMSAWQRVWARINQVESGKTGRIPNSWMRIDERDILYVTGLDSDGDPDGINVETHILEGKHLVVYEDDDGAQVIGTNCSAVHGVRIYSCIWSEVEPISKLTALVINPRCEELRKLPAGEDYAEIDGKIRKVIVWRDNL